MLALKFCKRNFEITITRIEFKDKRRIVLRRGIVVLHSSTRQKRLSVRCPLPPSPSPSPSPGLTPKGGGREGGRRGEGGELWKERGCRGGEGEGERWRRDGKCSYKISILSLGRLRSRAVEMLCAYFNKLPSFQRWFRRGGEEWKEGEEEKVVRNK